MDEERCEKCPYRVLFGVKFAISLTGFCFAMAALILKLVQ